MISIGDDNEYVVILREVDQPASRVDRWKPAFESHYNVSWEFLHSRGGLHSASKELVRIFDYPYSIETPFRLPATVARYSD